MIKKIFKFLLFLVGLFVAAVLFLTIAVMRELHIRENNASEKTTNVVDAPVNNAKPEQIQNEPKPVSNSALVKVSYIDVGQGDSTLISMDGFNMLIDTGTYEAYDNVQAVLAENNVDTIGCLVLTHPDADHIQNADEIIRDYNVMQVFMTDAEKDTKTYQDLITAINTYDIPVEYPTAGDQYEINDVKFDILGPQYGCEYEDTNSYSIIIKMVYGETNFLFLGDATGEEIADVPNSDFSADVYKAAHHGSANCGCNSVDLLNAANPEFMVISCGYQNDYGHPHRETMEFASSYGLKLYRTDLQGTITCVTDGNSIYWDQQPSTNYICGSDE